MFYSILILHTLTLIPPPPLVAEADSSEIWNFILLSSACSISNSLLDISLCFLQQATAANYVPETYPSFIFLILISDPMRHP